jgi:hypothetical protein
MMQSRWGRDMLPKNKICIACNVVCLAAVLG